MTRVVSTRFLVSYPDPALRDEPADVPADIKRVVDGLELAAMYSTGTIGGRPAAGTVGRIYFATDTTQLWWDTGSTWILVGPPSADSITAVQIAANAITASELADNAVDTAAIADLAVTAGKVAVDTITAAQIAANAITASELADNAVDTAAIATGAVTAAKIANDTITAAQIAPDGVGSSEIAPNSVTASELGDGAVDTAAIQALAVTPAKLSATPMITLARRNSVQGISTNAWTDVVWDIQSVTQGDPGTTFWNNSNAFDLLATGLHDVLATISFDASGTIGVRILDVGLNQVMAQQGPFAQAAVAGGKICCHYREWRASVEYIVQVFSSAGGNIDLSGNMPLVVARVDR